MTLDGLSPEQIEVRQQELLREVPEINPVGNKTLREKLGATWSEDLYWEIRNRLVERGVLETGRGKGGSVKRVSIQTPVQAALEVPPIKMLDTDDSRHMGLENSVPDYSRELNLYLPIATVLRNQWAKAQGFDSHLVEITANQGSRQTRGKWSRPDVIVVGYKTFPYLPGRYLEIVSFEIKPTNSTDVSAVYEALAHRRAATRAHVVVHIPSAHRTEMETILEAITEEAKKLGIGIVIADDPTDFDTWEVLLEASRVEPDPSRLNEFIAQQTTPELKEQIVRWFK